MNGTIPIIAATLLQYTAVTAPVFVPATQDAPQTMDRWEPRYPSRVPAAPRNHAAYELRHVAPLHVPDVTDPVPELSWEPEYPDFARGVRIPTAHIPHQEFAPLHVPRVNSGTDDIGGAVISTGSVPILQYQSITAPIFVPVPDRSWHPCFVDRVWPRRGLHVSLHQAYAADRLDAAPTPPAAPALSWQPRFPERVPARPGTHASRQQAYASDRADLPSAAPAPFLSWKPTFPDRHVYRRPLAPYTWVEPMFGYVVEVPVQAWLPSYPTMPTRRTSSHGLRSVVVGPLDVEGTIQPPAVPLSWKPTFPDRVPEKPRSLAALEARTEAPLYVADVTTTAPALSWTPRYPDLCYSAPRLLAGQQPAFSFDTRFIAPNEVFAPEMAAPVFPDRAPGRQPLVPLSAESAPLFVPEVTSPVPTSSWAPNYPDFVFRVQMATAAQSSLAAPTFVPDVTQAVPDLAWRSVYPDWIAKAPPRPRGGVTAPVREPDPPPAAVVAKTAIVGTYITTTAITGTYVRTSAITGTVEGD